MHDWMNGHWGWGWLMMAFMVLFWLLVVGGIVWLVVWLTQRSQPLGGQAESALEILRKRYARGEINKEEFDRMKQDLQ